MSDQLREISWYIVKNIFFLPSIPFPSRFKRKLLCWFGAKMGRGVVVKPRVNINMPWNLTMGDFSWIGEETYIMNLESLTIGKNVCISQRSFICDTELDGNYPRSSRKREITLKDGCWIGAGCFIGPDVTVGVDVVVAAGSVVTRNLVDNGVYKGTPARFIKERWELRTSQ